jgi:SAM-dependent methyltransferase
MHVTSLENMRKCIRRYGGALQPASNGPLEVVDIGASDVNGSYRALFADKKFRYRGVDLEAAPGVDIVLKNPYELPIDTGTVDLVISGQAFEHIEYFWRTFAEMVRIMRPGGLIFLIAPSAGPEHRYPVDCYRFYRDAFAALAKDNNSTMIYCWRDERGPWHDLVGVFQHSNARPVDRSDAAATAAQPAWSGSIGTADEEKQFGRLDYLKVLAQLHAQLRPRSYLEIGVRTGRSLRLAKGPAIGVDPDPDVAGELPPNIKLVRCESDVFFEGHAKGVRPDFAFIDGMHLFEFALRDFMNIERIAQPHATVVIDDIFPNHPKQANRERQTRVWTGDVWKLLEILREYRKDLTIRCINTVPTGLAVITGLNPKDRTLWQQYNPIVRKFMDIGEPLEPILKRRGAIDPLGFDFRTMLQGLQLVGEREPATVVQRTAPKSGLKLSVVVVAFDMEREFKSLSPAMQRDIAVGDYEIIVVDNGSRVPVVEAKLKTIAPNVRVLRIDDAGVSPVPAINRGLTAARGHLVGVFVDGARMASPGLLAKALAAAMPHEQPVIGTIAFHLGPKNQADSLAEGYNQAVEDELLAKSEWEANGYRLFDISVFAGSSLGGWFDPPAESNAVFLTRDHWIKLGGYDARFVSPGGGLCNHDLWERACMDADTLPIILLGEATFHQAHGGVATGMPRGDERQELGKTFLTEYVQVRGRDYKRPKREMLYFGTLSEKFLARS